MSKTADAIIIGAGVIGAAVAYELARLGWKTLSIDRNQQAGHGSTAGSCAIIRIHYSTLDGTALAWEGYHYWKDWSEYLKAPAGESLAKFLQTGCLVFKTEANGHLQQHMAHCRTLECPFEEWSNEQIRQRLPIYDLQSYAPARTRQDPLFGNSNGSELQGAVYWPTAGYVTDPALSAANLADAAARLGAVFRYGETVTELQRSGNRVRGVRLSDGQSVESPVVINVAGPGSWAINTMAGVIDEMTITTRPLRQEVVHMPAPDGFDFETDGMVVSDSDIACYCRPEHGNHILVGSEDPACDTHQWVDTDTDYNRSFSEQWTTQAMRYAQRVPGIGIPGQARGVVDLYDASTDWIPIYDKTSLGGYYMACGTSGNQYKNAPIAGKLMAALVEACENGLDHDNQPLQFRLPYIDRVIDTGFYSRKRPINQESSFSVLG